MKREKRFLGFAAWAAVDWSKPDTQIAADLGVRQSSVWRQRRKAESRGVTAQSMTLAVIANAANPKRRKFLGYVFARSLHDGVDEARRKGWRGSLQVMAVEEARALVGNLPEPQVPSVSRPSPPKGEGGMRVGDPVRASPYGVRRCPTLAGEVGEVEQLTPRCVFVRRRGVTLRWPQKYWEVAPKEATDCEAATN